MTISVAAIIGALFAIIIICVIVERSFRALAVSGWSVHPVIPIVIWGLVIVLSLFLIAWAFGITIPLVKLG